MEVCAAIILVVLAANIEITCQKERRNDRDYRNYQTYRRELAPGDRACNGCDNSLQTERDSNEPAPDKHASPKAYQTSCDTPPSGRSLPI